MRKKSTQATKQTIMRSTKKYEIVTVFNIMPPDATAIYQMMHASMLHHTTRAT